MKRAFNIYLLIASILFLGIGGCAVTDIDRSVDFTQYRSFAWGKSSVKVKNPAHDSDLIDKKIKLTIENELEKRGIRYDETNPDFRIRYQTYTEKEQRTRGNRYFGFNPFFHPFYYPFDGYRYGWGVPYWGGQPEVYTYTEGTLIVDVIDARTNEQVWRGMVSGNVDNISALQKQLEKGIRAILKKYPVTPQEPLSIPEKVVS